MNENYRQRQVDLDALARGLIAGERAALARAITLIESAAPQHKETARALLGQLTPHSGKTIRVGISGVPGAGKSTFIDSFGCMLTARGKRVAVLAVDPSSLLSGGSILGDKTRMERLAREERAFIRPSPSGGILGGVAGRTREAILLCEAAGYDVILVETVGTGQSEATLRGMVDFFMLLLITGAGDELQGIKKGVIEIADALVINKADGDNIAAAGAARAQFSQSLRLVAPATTGWRTRVFTASGQSGAGIDEIWRTVGEFVALTQANGVFAQRRAAQQRDWLHEELQAQLRARLYGDAAFQAALPEIEAAVVKGELPPATAAERLLQICAQPTLRS